MSGVLLRPFSHHPIVSRGLWTRIVSQSPPSPSGSPVAFQGLVKTLSSMLFGKEPGCHLGGSAAKPPTSGSPQLTSRYHNGSRGGGEGSNYAAGGGGGGAWSSSRGEFHATTILCVRKDGKVVLIGDGQVSQGSMIVKPNAKKIRRIGEGVVAGFAGSAADGMSLLERLEMKLEEHPGQLLRAAVELAKQWRQDKALRFLQAELLVADATTTLTVSGNGDVLEPHDGVMAIGSGGAFATAAARALIDVEGMDSATIAAKSMKIASDMCVYTNNNFISETLTAAPPATDDNGSGTGTAGGSGEEAAAGASSPTTK